MEMRYEDLYDIDPYAYLLLWKAIMEAGWNIPRGTTVVATDWAIQNGVAKKGERGIIVGFSRPERKCIYVRRAGKKTANSYWPGFWRDASLKLL